MRNRHLQSNLLLLLTALIWGFSFVTQTVGMKTLGPFTLNALRFSLGAISLLPILFYFRRKRARSAAANLAAVASDVSISPPASPHVPNVPSAPSSSSAPAVHEPVLSRASIIAGVIIGLVLFAGISFQQVGMLYTSTGKAAFITGMYIVLVPVFGLFLRQRPRRSTWVGVAVAAVGLYLVSVREDFTIGFGDLLEIIGAGLWAVHILVIDHYAKKFDTILLSFLQFVTCSTLSFGAAMLFENITIAAISTAILPVLYGGFLAVGVAFTLQVVGQKHADPSHAAIIFSLEAVFAAIGSALLLGENLGVRGYAGCALMLLGMVATQIRFEKKEV